MTAACMLCLCRKFLSCCVLLVMPLMLICRMFKAFVELIDVLCVVGLGVGVGGVLGGVVLGEEGGELGGVLGGEGAGEGGGEGGGLVGGGGGEVGRGGRGGGSRRDGFGSVFMMCGVALHANPPDWDCASGYDSRAFLLIMCPLATAWARDGSYFLGVG